MPQGCEDVFDPERLAAKVVGCIGGVDEAAQMVDQRPGVAGAMRREPVGFNEWL